jgi:ATP-binding cassette, subfamily B, bacterial MsbA
MFQSWLALWPFLKPYRYKIFFALFLGVILAQLSVVLPVLANSIILGFQEKTLVDDSNFLKLFRLLNISDDSWLAQLDHKQLVTYVAFSFPIYYLIFGLVRYYHFFFFKFVGEQVISDIRVALMNKFMEMDVLYLGRQKKGSGGILSRTLNDTIILQQGLQYYGDLIREPIMGVFLIGYMFFINWQITLGCFVFLPIFATVIRYISKSLKKFGYQSQEALEEVTRTLKEGLDGVRVIQSFNLQNHIQDKFKRQVNDYLNKRKKIIKREELGSPINEWFASILVCGVCLFQAQLIWQGKSDVGGFIAFLIAAGMLDKPVKKSQQAIIYVQQNIVALERLQEVLASHTEVQEPKTPKPFPRDWSEIQFKDVSFSYQDKVVLKNINLNIRRGEVVALVGESGSGKSTLAGLLQRFFDPVKGQVLIGDIPVSQMMTRDLRANIGYVTQDVFLFDDSIENNIWFGNLERDPSEVIDAAQMANASEFVAATGSGFQSNVGERGGRLSGGEKQRISIARALFKDPPVLILDEATSALDSASEHEVQKGIDKLIKGRTALVIAHRLSTIMNSDRIIVMKDGEIVEEGDHSSLLAKQAEYARFYNLQFSPESKPQV